MYRQMRLLIVGPSVVNDCQLELVTHGTAKLSEARAQCFVKKLHQRGVVVIVVAVVIVVVVVVAVRSKCHGRMKHIRRLPLCDARKQQTELASKTARSKR